MAQIAQATTNQSVPDVAAFGHRSQPQARWSFGLEVLGRVDCQICVSFEDERLNLFAESTLATDIDDAEIEPLVSGGFEIDDFHLEVGLS